MRASGILLPISSLHSPYGIGTLGAQAYEFIDFLQLSGQKYWQILPIGPTGYGDSPYQTFCSFAGSSYLIDLDILNKQGLLKSEEYKSIQWGENDTCVDYGLLYNKRLTVLKHAYERFNIQDEDFLSFCDKHIYWLNDYAIFMSLKEHFDGLQWSLWPEDIRLRKQEALEQYGVQLSYEILFHKFLQYIFFKQWEDLKEYAFSKGIKIIGDMPIYVSADSSDAWSRFYLFQMDENRNLSFVAGVPPDAFSATGQLWGNPLYDWDAMEKDNYYWWSTRIEISAMLFDVVRIDHFIGVERYFSIPYGAKTAAEGTYHKGPGMKLINIIEQSRGSMEIIAEDLGVLTEEVVALLKASGYPGMKVIQFGFSQDPSNEHLPMNYKNNLIAYTATHDNDTTKGWLKKLNKKEVAYIKKILNKRCIKTRDIVFETLKSTAIIAIIPMQDWLNQDSRSRINYPSVAFGNWTYRIKGSMLNTHTANRIKKLCWLSNRC